MSLASSSTSLEETPRQEAGPLPTKRGEIGFREELHVQVEERDGGGSPPLPARHPADRDTSTPIISSDAPVDAAAAEASSTATDSSSLRSKKKFISFFNPTYGGIRLMSLLVFIFQLFLLGGTIAGWALSIIFLNKRLQGSQQGQNIQINSTTIIIHIVFGLIVIAELTFLERRLFHLRAERYCYLHPGEVLPTSIRRTSRTSITRGLGMGFAPWNRPSLPTYAAALAQSGYGTGDVEDEIIAAPPPPAYGNTRGSTLLLSGFLRDSLRAQRPSSQGSQHAGLSESNERAMSDVNRDEGLEAAERSRRLEETLAALERPTAVQ